ncbi:MAG TPA: hypothetical protein DCY66_07820 [Bacteroides sp.]|nr:hypothetical protein [Bacteroides sp.]
MRFNGSNIKKSVCLIVLPLKRGNFNTARMMTAELTLGIIIPFLKGNDIPQCVGYCLLSAVGFSTTTEEIITIVPTLFPFN